VAAARASFSKPMTAVTVTCPVCEGEGVIPSPDSDDFALDIVCPACGGEGYLDAEVDDE